MRVWPALGLALMALPCAGGPTEPPTEPPSATPPAPAASAPAPAAAAPAAIPAENVRTVTIDPNSRPPVCRRVVPTGSRIAERRCESPKEPTALDEANRDVLRRDVQALRDQQMMRDQARQAAMAEALRRAQGR